MVDDREPEADSDLRKRAAWLLAMLAVVAVLLVVVMSQLGGGSGNKNGNSGPRALDSAVGSHSSSSSNHSSSRSQRTSTAPAAGGSSTSAHPRSKCPSQQTCVLDGDVGNGIAAINEYRTKNGKSAVPGRVSTQAQQCALNNGNGCSGGWAETELAAADGAQAVQKILPFAHLLDTMKNVEVGWAYDPGAKLYYFAIIRNS